MEEKQNSNQGLFSESEFAEEIEALNAEIDDINELYDTTREHLEAIKRNIHKGSLTFVQYQTANLVSMKTAKLNLLKEKIGIKKNIVDFRFKKENLAKDNENSDFNYIETLKKIAEEQRTTVTAEPKANDLPKNSSNIDDELDSVLEKNNIDVSIASSDALPSVIEENTSNETSIVYANDKHFYRVNEDFEILEDLGEDYDSVDISSGVETDEGLLVPNENGDVYLYLEVEE